VTKVTVTAQRSPRAAARALAQAAWALRARTPDMKATTIAMHLRRCGWPATTPDDVRRVLRADPCDAGHKLTLRAVAFRGR
jgi:hypothetical protein